MPAVMRNGYAYAIATALVLAWTTLWPAPTAACGTTPAAKPQYVHRARAVAGGLCVPAGYAPGPRWTLRPEAPALMRAGLDVYGRPLRLAPRAAAALGAMVDAAARDGIALQAVSGYRSFGHQRRLLRRKLDHGTPLAAVFEVTALPGFSEHHGGCALDLTTPGVPAADAAFASTPAFAWFATHASHFGFALSYPAGNARGIDFEPWHWRYAGPPPADEGLLAETPSTHAGAAPVGVSIRTYPIVQGYP
jgi:D-alanyl-D-alanine carboxypeptidase